MKYFIKNNRKKIKEYWQNSMNSLRLNMSRGAQNLMRMIPWARRDNWRRDDKKQHRG